MGRHIYNKDDKFIKTTIFINEENYNKLQKIKCDYFDRRSMKEIVNKALSEYLIKD